MNRYSLNKNVLKWVDMVVWLQETFGEAQGWDAQVLEPTHLKKSFKWAIGEHRVRHDDPDSIVWPCFWIPNGAAYTLFRLKWDQ